MSKAHFERAFVPRCLQAPITVQASVGEKHLVTVRLKQGYRNGEAEALAESRKTSRTLSRQNKTTIVYKSLRCNSISMWTIEVGRKLHLCSAV